jgi:phenylalanyl-tRNA synthetase alpha subunit
MKLTKAKLLEIVEEELQEIIKKSNDKNGMSEEKADKHFSPQQSPGQADNTFSDCIDSVKKSFKKHKYKPYSGDTIEDAAAKICTDARKEGGATLDYGEKRKKEIEKERPGGKSGK